MLSSKITLFPRRFLLAIVFLVSIGLFGCEEVQNQSNSNDDASSQVVSEDNAITEDEPQLICTTFCSGILLGPEGSSPLENDVEWVIDLETQTGSGEPGPSVAEMLDSLSWQIEARTNSGWYLPSLHELPQDSPIDNCNPSVVKLGEPEFNEDSTQAILNSYLLMGNEGCTLNVSKAGGSLVVIVAEGLPDKAGEVKILNVKGWKDGRPVTLTVKERKE